MSGSDVNRSAVAFVAAAASAGWLVVVSLAWAVWHHPEEAFLTTAAILLGWAMTSTGPSLTSGDHLRSEDSVSNPATHPVRAHAHRARWN